MTKSNNHKLAARIAEYWKSRGHLIQIQVERNPDTQQHYIASNMIDGLPRSLKRGAAA